jgi:hypothetical protein
MKVGKHAVGLRWLRLCVSQLHEPCERSGNVLHRPQQRRVHWTYVYVAVARSGGLGQRVKQVRDVDEGSGCSNGVITGIRSTRGRSIGRHLTLNCATRLALSKTDSDRGGLVDDERPGAAATMTRPRA